MDTDTTTRRRLQWALAPLVLLVIALGWKVPLLGFVVPIVMIGGMLGGLWRGRIFCGWLCPRGGFLERLLGPLARGAELPSWAYGLRLRLALFVGLMGFLIGRLLQAPGDWRHWGYVFWEMCLVTTAVALIGGLLFRPRAWCVICPMGTMQNLLGGTRGRLGLAPERCVACGACDRACTLSLPVSQHRERGRVAERDCLLCGECVAACPRGALRGGRTASTPQRECA